MNVRKIRKRMPAFAKLRLASAQKAQKIQTTPV
jgi:hypothetical protein